MWFVRLLREFHTFEQAFETRIGAKWIHVRVTFYLGKEEISLLIGRFQPLEGSILPTERCKVSGHEKPVSNRIPLGPDRSANVRWASSVRPHVAYA